MTISSRSLLASAAAVAAMAIAGVDGAKYNRKASTAMAVNPDGRTVGVSHRMLQSLPATGGVAINGLNKPISVHWDVYGNIFVLEKAGIIKRVNSWIGTAVDVVLDISAHVSYFGDHGFTSILWHDGYIYGTYMKLNYKWGHDCADYGQMDGRPRIDVEGCNIYGRFSRWPINPEGVIAGPEEVILDTEVGNKACAQFATHSTPACVTMKDGYFYLSLGDGAAFTTVDPGDLGHNPCGDTAPYVGGFRSQDPNRWNGKTLRLDPNNSWSVEVMTTGHRNPFRLTTAFNEVYATETGWYTWEEFNYIEKGVNLGWPCREGNQSTPEYGGLQTCTDLIAQGIVFREPTYWYYHPQIVAPMVTSISALAGWNGKFYVGDYSAGWIKSLDKDPNSTGVIMDSEVLIMRDVYPVEMKVTDDNVLIYVDHGKGEVKTVLVGTALASPSPIAVPTAEIIPLQTEWTPFVGTLTFGSTSNIAGREGADYTWTVLILRQCGVAGPTQACEWTYLFESTIGATLSFNPPYIPPGESATLELTLTVNTGLGKTQGKAPAIAVYRIPSVGSQPCTCAGVRTNTVLPDPPAGVVWTAGTGTGGGTVGTGGPANLVAPVAPGKATLPTGAIQPAGANGKAVVTPMSPSWTTDGTPIAFVSSSILDTDAAANYTWNVYVYDGCGVNYGVSKCSWVLINTVGPAVGRVLTMDPPKIKLSLKTGTVGTTIAVEAIGVSSDGGTAVRGFGFVPQANPTTGLPMQACTCDGVAEIEKHMGSLVAANGATGDYVYAEAIAQGVAIPSASSSPSNLPSASSSPSTVPGSGTNNGGSNAAGTSSSSSSGLSTGGIIGIAVAGGVVGILLAALIAITVYKKRIIASEKAAAAAAAADKPVTTNSAGSASPVKNGAAAGVAARRGVGVSPLELANGGNAQAPNIMSPPGQAAHVGKSPKGNRRV